MCSDHVSACNVGDKVKIVIPGFEGTSLGQIVEKDYEQSLDNIVFVEKEGGGVGDKANFANIRILGVPGKLLLYWVPLEKLIKKPDDSVPQPQNLTDNDKNSYNPWGIAGKNADENKIAGMRLSKTDHEIWVHHRGKTREEARGFGKVTGLIPEFGTGIQRYEVQIKFLQLKVPGVTKNKWFLEAPDPDVQDPDGETAVAKQREARLKEMEGQQYGHKNIVFEEADAEGLTFFRPVDKDYLGCKRGYNPGEKVDVFMRPHGCFSRGTISPDQGFASNGFYTVDFDDGHRKLSVKIHEFDIVPVLDDYDVKTYGEHKTCDSNDLEESLALDHPMENGLQLRGVRMPNSRDLDTDPIPSPHDRDPIQTTPFYPQVKVGDVVRLKGLSSDAGLKLNGRLGLYKAPPNNQQRLTVAFTEQQQPLKPDEKKQLNQTGSTSVRRHDFVLGLYDKKFKVANVEVLEDQNEVRATAVKNYYGKLNEAIWDRVTENVEGDLGIGLCHEGDPPTLVGRPRLRNSTGSENIGVRIRDEGGMEIEAGEEEH